MTETTSLIRNRLCRLGFKDAPADLSKLEWKLMMFVLRSWGAGWVPSKDAIATEFKMPLRHVVSMYARLCQKGYLQSRGNQRQLGLGRRGLQLAYDTLKQEATP